MGDGEIWNVLECLGLFPLQPGHILPPVTFIALDCMFQIPSFGILEHQEPLELNPGLSDTHGRGVTPQLVTLAQGSRNSQETGERGPQGCSGTSESLNHIST